jgi:hypothetical protein
LEPVLDDREELFWGLLGTFCSATKGYILPLPEAIIPTSREFKAKKNLLVGVFGSDYSMRIKSCVYSSCMTKNPLLADLSPLLPCRIELCIEFILKLSFFW